MIKGQRVVVSPLAFLEVASGRFLYILMNSNEIKSTRFSPYSDENNKRVSISGKSFHQGGEKRYPIRFPYHVMDLTFRSELDGD